MLLQWEKCLGLLRGKVSESVFTEFGDLKISSCAGNRCLIIVPHGKDPKAVLPYKPLFELSWQEANGSKVEFDFQRLPETPQNSAAKPSFIEGFTPSVKLSPDYRFDNFVVGDKSQLAFSAAFAVAENPNGNKYNPLFIYGASGLGKTHLLQAIGNFVLEEDANKRVRYVTAFDFQQEYVNSLRAQRANEMSAYYREEVDVLLIDDIQHWSGKDETQNEFFHIFNALHQAGKQVVLTSDAPASEVKSLSDRLVSRFSWGLTVDIQPPNVETREAILRKKAESNHLDISDDVIVFLAESIESNVRLLEGAILKLMVQSSVSQQDIDLNIAKRVVAEMIPTIKRHVNKDSIIHAVCNHFEVSEDKLLESGRGTKEVAHARQIAMFLMKKFTTLSLKSIGIRFGGRDHSTVVHAIKTVEKEIQNDPAFARTIDTLKSAIHD
ncbi:MAG: chromosomal replication initiator protein DnaA [Fibrobacter sp.]|jgi:chromosomal replication initiator protein|nr:chromosomal replication initiator protein DnaA [Fibrobacter sp.]